MARDGWVRDAGVPALWSEGMSAATRLPFEEQHKKNMHILGLIHDEPGWALSRILLAERLEEAVNHVIADSPGTPETVKGYLRKAKRGF